MVRQFLLYRKVNQLYVYIYPHIPSLLRLPPTLPIPPLQVVTKHRADLPVLCGCFPLAIYFTFGSVYMSMPLSHFGIISFFLWLGKFHCIYTPHPLYPFICQWTLRLLPCPGYCKQRCYEHQGECIFSNQSFLWIYVQEWDCWVIWQFYFQFFKETPYCSPQWLHQFTFPPMVQEGRVKCF